MAAAPLSLKARALQWLAQREQSRVELRRKLLRFARRRSANCAEASGEGGVASESDLAVEVEALLDWLVAHRYLCDARFVESRVNARSARYGNLRIRHELGQHGAVLDTVAAERLKDSELARARTVWLRKYGSAPASSTTDRARQMRFLAGRGFSSEAIRRVVQGDQGDADDLA
jgi:regulatory protein